MNKKALFLPGLILLLAALLHAGLFFVPYVSAAEEYRDTIDAMGDQTFTSDSDLTYADMKDISLFEYARFSVMYGETFGSEEYKWIYGILYSSAGVIAVLMILTALAKKPILTVLLDLLGIGVIRIVNWDLVDRGIINENRMVWGIAHYLYYLVLLLIAAAAVWLLVVKIKGKKSDGGIRE